MTANFKIKRQTFLEKNKKVNSAKNLIVQELKSMTNL